MRLTQAEDPGAIRSGAAEAASIGIAQGSLGDLRTQNAKTQQSLTKQESPTELVKI
jgi:hypothetical protein